MDAEGGKFGTTEGVTHPTNFDVIVNLDCDSVCLDDTNSHVNIKDKSL